jgi:hypothetical protein
VSPDNYIPVPVRGEGAMRDAAGACHTDSLANWVRGCKRGSSADRVQ